MICGWIVDLVCFSLFGFGLFVTYLFNSVVYILIVCCCFVVVLLLVLFVWWLCLFCLLCEFGTVYR